MAPRCREIFGVGGYWRRCCPEFQSGWAMPGASLMTISSAGMIELPVPTWRPRSSARPARLHNPDVYIHLGILRIRRSLIIDFKIGFVGPVATGFSFGYGPDAGPGLRNHLSNESRL